MTVATVTQAARPTRPARRTAGEWRLALRFALREMRGGLRGFVIFLLCIALGVAAIAAVNSVSTMMTDGIAREGRTILGGDARFGLVQRPAAPAERAYLQSLGTVTEIVSMRSMTRDAGGGDPTLVELKAVDGAYPLYGAALTTPNEPLDALLSERNGRYGVLAAPELLERLNIRPGTVLRVGALDMELRGTLDAEPDVLSDGFAFAPRLLLSRAAMDATGLIQPGSLVEYDYKLRLAAPTEPRDLLAQANERFPSAGWNIRTADNAAPSLQRNIERFGQFLTLVGLTALIVGGVGVANAVGAYLSSKRAVIASFKSLGASGGFVVKLYLLQIAIMAGIGIAFGLVLGALAPFAAAGFLSSVLPVATHPSVYPPALLVAALFGILNALAFALLPLGRTRDVPATALFREAGGASASGRPGWFYRLVTGLLALAIAGLALLVADDRVVAVTFLAATAVAFAILRLVAFGVARLAKAAPHSRRVFLRLAVANIHRPGALTPSVTLSLGLGLTLLVALGTIDTNLRGEIAGNLAARAPDFFFVDIQNTEMEPFRERIAALAPGATLEAAPMLRGRIARLNGVDSAEVKVPPEGAWVLRGDRGITYADALPKDSSLTDGQWWPKDYAGEPLVSFAAEQAKQIGLKVGDTITVNVLGRDITARIANLRTVDWESLSINFVMVFSPNAFAGAPHAWLATLALAKDDPEAERQVLRGVAQSDPTVTMVRVRDALDAVNRLVEQLAVAIRAAAAVALVASVLVLSGALAAGNRSRIHDAVVLKTLGATRRTLIAAYASEYLLLGAATAAFAILAGAASAWYVIERIMRLNFVFQPGVALTVLLVSLILTVGIGLVGTWRVLGQKAAPVLRDL